MSWSCVAVLDTMEVAGLEIAMEGVGAVVGREGVGAVVGREGVGAVVGREGVGSWEGVGPVVSGFVTRRICPGGLSPV